MKSKITVKVPASTANLGPGFDSLALALSLYTTVVVEIKPDQTHPMLKLVGPIAQQLPAGSDNLVWKILKDLWPENPANPVTFNQASITITSEIPLARGLGSSAAATIAAAWAALSIEGKRPSYQQVLKAALNYESHPDNLSASLIGSFVVSSVSESECRYEKLNWPEKWKVISIIAQQSLSTTEARAVLPKEIPLPDVAYNIQKTATLVAAVARGDEHGLKHALNDKVHQPYRRSLIPLLAETKERLADLPHLGCVISGAGPSITVIVGAGDLDTTLDTLKKWSVGKKNISKILSVPVAAKGVQATYD